MESVQESLDILLPHFPTVTLHEYASMGHFCIDDMKTEQFPDLLDVIVGQS